MAGMTMRLAVPVGSDVGPGVALEMTGNGVAVATTAGVGVGFGVGSRTEPAVASYVSRPPIAIAIPVAVRIAGPRRTIRYPSSRLSGIARRRR
jgi:hypothetical protein